MDQGESRPRDESQRVDGGQTRGDEVADRSAGGLYHDERAGGAAGDIERAGQSMISASSISSAGGRTGGSGRQRRSEEHTSELQSRQYLVCRLLLEKKKKIPPSHRVDDISRRP